MQAEVFCGDGFVPLMPGVENFIGEPIAPGNIPGPKIEEIHVGLAPPVLPDARALVEFQEIGDSHQDRRRYDDGQHQAAMVC